MDAKLAKIYYSPQGYWKGVSAIKKLTDASKVSENVVKQWLYKQAIWQIFLPAPRYVPRPKFDVATPNSVHQVDLLFLPHDKLRRKTYKYALTVVDIASRYKEAEPLTSKDSNQVARAFQAIYKRGPLTWPSMLQVDPGREFMGSVTKEMDKHKTFIRRGRTEIHRDQAIVERFNRTLAERLFGHQYAVEMLHAGRSTVWVKRLPDVVNALNNEVTRLTGKKPASAIKEKNIVAKPSTLTWDLLVWTKKNFHLSSMWGICISLANLRVVPKEQQISSGLWKSTRLLKIWQNQMSQLFIICLTGPSVASFVKSC